jgi:hypothetical protein
VQTPAPKKKKTTKEKNQTQLPAGIAGGLTAAEYKEPHMLVESQWLAVESLGP